MVNFKLIMKSKIIFKIIKNIFTRNKKKIPKNLLNVLYNKRFEIINTHKNNTMLVFLKDENIFRKFSIDKNGIKKIKNEAMGLKWYEKKLKSPSKFFVKASIKKNYAFIDTKIIEGFKIKSWKSLSENYFYVIKAFKHYKKIFKKKKKTKLHGDLTLDNIFFTKKKVIFFDWEFFGSKPNYYGYDLAYFFLSTISLPAIAGNRITKDDETCFIKLWKKLSSEKINLKLIRDPFNFFMYTIKKDKILRQSYLISKKKFFPFITPVKLKNKIERLIKLSI